MLTKSKLENDTEIARAKRAFDVKKAEYDTEVNTAKAEADLAYNLRVRFFWGVTCPAHMVTAYIGRTKAASRIKGKGLILVEASTRGNQGIFWLCRDSNLSYWVFEETNPTTL